MDPTDALGRDRVRLRRRRQAAIACFVDVTRPRQTDTEGLKVPVIYESSPYFAGTSGDREVPLEREAGSSARSRRRGRRSRRSTFKPTRPNVSTSQVNTWVPRGFAVVHSEAPGTGLSQGCPTVGDAPEQLAPKAVIDWLNGRAKGFTTIDGSEEVVATSWSTGKVGMTGTSYNGTIPLAAATTGVAGLEAIIPIAPNTSYYHYYRSNGLVRHPGGWLGEDIDFLYDFINSGDPARRDVLQRAVPRRRVRARAAIARTGDYNDFWAARDLLHEGREHQGRGADGARVQRLERRARAQRAHLRGAEGARAAAGLLPPGRPRRRAAAGDDEQVVHALPLRRAERRREGAEGVDRARDRAGAAAGAGAGAPRRRGAPAPAAAAAAARRRRRRRTRTIRIPTRRPSRCVCSRGGGAQRRARGCAAPPKQGTEKLVDDVEFSGAGAREGRAVAAIGCSTRRPSSTAPVHISGLRARSRCGSRRASRRRICRSGSCMLPWTDGPIGPANLITRGWADPQNHDVAHERRRLPLEDARRAARAGPVLHADVRPRSPTTRSSRPASASA